MDVLLKEGGLKRINIYRERYICSKLILICNPFGSFFAPSLLEKSLCYTNICQDDNKLAILCPISVKIDISILSNEISHEKKILSPIHLI